MSIVSYISLAVSTSISFHYNSIIHQTLIMFYQSLSINLLSRYPRYIHIIIIGTEIHKIARLHSTRGSVCWVYSGFQRVDTNPDRLAYGLYLFFIIPPSSTLIFSSVVLCVSSSPLLLPFVSPPMGKATQMLLLLLLHMVVVCISSYIWGRVGKCCWYQLACWCVTLDLI